MAKVPGSGEGPVSDQSQGGKGVVDLAVARVRLRSGQGQPSAQEQLQELDEIRSLLDQGLSAEAKTRLASLISTANKNPSILALARCALSAALEMQGQFRDSLAEIGRASWRARVRAAAPA